MSDLHWTDTASDATRDIYEGTPLWRPWMREIRLQQCRNLAHLDEFLSAGAAHQELCWDIETKSLNPDPGEIVGHSIAFTGDEALYVPVRHLADPTQNLDPDEVFQRVIEALKPPKILTVYNARFENSFLMSAGIERPTGLDSVHDVMLMRWLYNSDDKKIGLKETTRRLFGLDMLEIRDPPGVALDRKQRGAIDFSRAKPCEATLYAAADVIMTLRVESKVWPVVVETGQEFIAELEHQLLRVMLLQERNHLRIDRAFLQRAEQDLLRWSEVVLGELYRLNGSPFNVMAPDQVAAFLRSRGVPMGKTPTGKDSTSAKDMAILSPQFPVVKQVALARSLLKEIGTYVRPMLHATTEERPYGAAQILQHASTTGRLSSKAGQPGDPRFLPLNLMAIPAADAYEVVPCRLVHNPPRI
jgi:DNA polymerase-1